MMNRERLEQIKRHVQEEAATGLDLSPGNAVCAEALELFPAVEELIGALRTARGLMHPLAVDGPRLDAILSRYRSADQ